MFHFDVSFHNFIIKPSDRGRDMFDMFGDWSRGDNCNAGFAVLVDRDGFAGCRKVKKAGEFKEIKGFLSSSESCLNFCIGGMERDAVGATAFLCR